MKMRGNVVIESPVQSMLEIYEKNKINVDEQGIIILNEVNDAIQMIPIPLVYNNASYYDLIESLKSNKIINAVGTFHYEVVARKTVENMYYNVLKLNTVQEFKKEPVDCTYEELQREYDQIAAYLYNVAGTGTFPR